MPTGTPAKSTKKLREMIKAEELIKILQDNAIHTRRQPLHQNRVNAINILLKKCLPDLKAIEQTTTIEGEIDLNVQVEFLE